MSLEMLVLYYGEGCPHCRLVEDYLEEYGPGENISLEQKEVFHNQENLAELRKKALSAGVPEDFIGVPCLFDGDRCMVGDEEILDFFRQSRKS